MPFDEEKQIQQLIEMYRQGFEEILRIIIEKEAKGQWTQYWRDLLLEVRAILQQLDQYADQWIEQTIGQVYSQAAAQTVVFLSNLGKEKQARPEFAQIHQRAIDVVAQNMAGNLRDATQFIGRRINDVFRRVGLEQTGRKLAAGQTWYDMKQKVIQQLLDKGQTAFVDRLGRKWRLDTYAEMVARTTTREAASVATLNTCQEFGLDLVRITTHYPTCEKCAPLQGKVFSISGRDRRYPKLTDERRPPIHPNCRHVLTPYVRELDDNAEETERFSNQPLDVDPRSEAEKQAYAEMRDKVTVVNIRQRARRELLNPLIPIDKKVEAAKRLKKSYELTREKPKGIDVNLIKEYEELIKQKEKLPLEHYVEIVGLPDEAKEGLAYALKEAIEYGKNTGRECLIHIDARTGKKVYLTVEGNEGQVIIPPAIKDILNSAEKRSIIQVHNHPWSSSFSGADINIAMAFESISHVAVIGHDGTRYIFSRGNGQKPEQKEILLQYMLLKDKYYNQFAQEVIAGRMTKEQAWKEHSHLIIQDLAEMYGWEYRRVLPNEI